MRYILMALLAGSVWAQEETKKPWTNQIDLAGVFTSGNSESSHLSFKDIYTYTSGASTFKLNLGAVRAENARFTRRAVGSTDAFTVEEDKENQLSAENYAVGLGYNRKFGERTSWFVSADWQKDEIAGIKSRLGVAAGIATDWIATDRHKLTTSYGAKWIQQEEVVEPPGYDDSYPAVTLKLDQSFKATKTATYTQGLTIDFNTDETDDYLADWQHGFAVNVSTRIALKLGLQFKYDNQPAFESIPLVGTDQSVFAELDELDTIFTSSIVINF